LLFSGLAFFVLLPLMKRTETISLDTDWLWRRAAPAVIGLLEQALHWLDGVRRRGLESCRRFFKNITVRYLGQPHTADSEEEGIFARSWLIGTTALWIAGLLSAYVLLYYL